MSNIQELIVPQERGSLNSNDGENKTQARVVSSSPSQFLYVLCCDGEELDPASLSSMKAIV